MICPRCGYAPLRAASKQLTPEFIAWKRRNPWLERNVRKTELALRIGESIFNQYVNQAFYDEIDRQLSMIEELAHG